MGARPRPPLVRIHDGALAPPTFRRVLRRVRALGGERLRDTYQTTFWYGLGAPTSVVEEAILELLPRLPSRRRLAGAEWWLSRMRTTDVRVDFHRDRDEVLATRGGPDVHPLFSSILYLNRARGGLLAVTEQPLAPENPACAPWPLDADLVRPAPNRWVVFPGTLVHGVLDAESAIPTRRLAGTSRLRLAVVVNWWDHRLTAVPTFPESRAYRSLALRGAAAV